MNYQQLMSIAQHIKGNEGENPYHSVYGDTTGHITTGYGFNVSDRDVFVAQPFRDATSKNPLSAKQKGQAYDTYQKAHAVDPNLSPQSHSGFDNVEFPNNFKESGVMDRVLGNEGKIRSDLGKDSKGNDVYDKLTDGQKTVMHDVYYANGSLDKFPNLTNAAKTGNTESFANESEFHGGTNQDGSNKYNYGRLISNRAAALGISEDEAKKQILNTHQNDYQIKIDNNVRNIFGLPPVKRTSDSGDGTGTQSAGDTSDQQQSTTAASQTISTDTDSDNAYDFDSHPTDEQMAAASKLPPEGTPQDQYLADLTGDDAPIKMAVMGQVLHDVGTQDGTIQQQPTTLLASNTDQDQMDQASVVPVGATSSNYLEDLTGDSEPVSFAAMGQALHDMGDSPPTPSLLGGNLGGSLA
jgi:hypothetical protein